MYTYSVEGSASLLAVAAEVKSNYGTSAGIEA